MKKFPQQPLMTCDEGLIGCVQERNTLHLQSNTELWNWGALFSNIIQHSYFIVHYSALKNLTAVKKTLLPIRTQQFTHQPCSSQSVFGSVVGQRSPSLQNGANHTHTLTVFWRTIEDFVLLNLAYKIPPNKMELALTNHTKSHCLWNFKEKTTSAL